MSFKNIRYLVSLIGVFIISFYVSANVAQAYKINGNYWSKPNSLKYYISASTIQEGYEIPADHGGKAWNPSTKVEITRSYSSTHDGTLTHIVSTVNEDIGGFYAQAGTYKSDGSQCLLGWSCSSYKGKVTINDPDFYKLSSDLKKETIVHEMGHILGLAHEDYYGSGYNVMISGDEQTGGWCYCTAPQKDDWDGINYIYP